ncbi:hypothetical protein BLOT_005318 [Blomia tropicalis]|nr:hypothetical protein BLOT_005318 [Blomia tropicalis]
MIPNRGKFKLKSLVLILASSLSKLLDQLAYFKMNGTNRSMGFNRFFFSVKKILYFYQTQNKWA